ncbi:hypothetical protein L2E82_03194 [Cichorium intybus]|uniref:Uncharacterized protein n=1 Tax=Cichorium intybus TaxID=13427 RepID=A0ACB9H4S5_CICIN|nr:hypothetical protein L2E82_03194 [Cichorium intybus]
MAIGQWWTAQQFELVPENVNTFLDDVRPYLVSDGGNANVVYGEWELSNINNNHEDGIERILKEKFGSAIRDIVQVFDE